MMPTPGTRFVSCRHLSPSFPTCLSTIRTSLCIMDSEKEETAAHIENVDSTDTDAEAGHLADQEDHHLSKREAIRRQPLAFAWCIFAVWTTLLVSFENQASGTVIGIPQFRKDFGNLYNGDYVIPANWQSAFSGAPVASYVHFL